MVKYELTPPKTPGSVRTIDVNDTVMELLQKMHERQAALKSAVAGLIDDYHDESFVFCRENCYPFIQKNIIVRMQRLLEKTSITKVATPHIFRHTHISMWTEAGVDITTIMKRVGHDDMKTTLKIYTHVTEKMKSNATEKVNNHFMDILKI